jgi:hypothetical protein
MVKKTFNSVLLILLGCAIIYFIISVSPKHGVIAYDCGLAEISPDYPLDVKQACRKLNAETYRNNR